jgi:MOSC domain-containing protein YiiM
MANPTVVAIHFNLGSRAPLVPASSATATPGQGLDGDRSRRPRRAVLLVEQEVLDRFELPAGAVREQVTVRGLALGDLPAGGRLRIGTVVLEAGKACDPCERMNEIRPGLRAELQGRRGRFFSVTEAGGFAVGDAITVLPPATAPAG